MIATGVGMAGAVVLGLLGLLSTAMLLIAIAFFGYFTCWQQRQMLKMGVYEAQGESGYDFSQGYTSLDDKSETPAQPGFFASRRAARAQRRAQQEQRRIEEHQQKVDQILAKIRTSGTGSLTRQERRTLESETQRQQQNGPPG